MKNKKPRVIWVIEDCKWKCLRGDWDYVKKSALITSGCRKCKAVKFVESKDV